jgi:hypothetical protein
MKDKLLIGEIKNQSVYMVEGGRALLYLSQSIRHNFDDRIRENDATVISVHYYISGVIDFILLFDAEASAYFREFIK